MKSLVNIIIYVITLFGIYGAFGLVSTEFQQGGICPKILGVPACYIIVVCLVLVLVFQLKLFKDKNRLFVIGTGFAWMIAATGAIGQLTGFLECPTTAEGIPMCYISFGIFSSLGVLKWIQITRS